MINVTNALDIIQQNALKRPSVKVPLAAAAGRVLREPLIADRDFPPFHRVTMDGIALAYADFAAGQRAFPIDGIGAAGMPQQQLQQAGHCIEIMTGAMLPEGADTIVRYEDLVIDGHTAHLQIDDISKGQNIHRQGHDRLKGSCIVEPGRLVSAAEIGVAATIGRSELVVSQPVSALILSSGDELVEVHQQPLPYQIRRSNVFTIQTLLQNRGVLTETAHVPDDKPTIETLLGAQLHRFDVLVLSGGVSKGKFDYIPEVLESLGVERLFHKVAQRPGKPFWFGRLPGGTVVFALPGNPVSTAMCTQVYIGAWLDACEGIRRERVFARLDREIIFQPDLSYFMQARLHSDENGVLHAEPIEGHGSGDLANLADADAFMWLPRGRDRFAAGEAFQVWRFRD